VNLQAIESIRISLTVITRNRPTIARKRNFSIQHKTNSHELVAGLATAGCDGQTMQIRFDKERGGKELGPRIVNGIKHGQDRQQTVRWIVT